MLICHRASDNFMQLIGDFWVTARGLEVHVPCFVDAEVLQTPQEIRALHVSLCAPVLIVSIGELPPFHTGSF